MFIIIKKNHSLEKENVIIVYKIYYLEFIKKRCKRGYGSVGRALFAFAFAFAFVETKNGDSCRSCCCFQSRCCECKHRFTLF